MAKMKFEFEVTHEQLDEIRHTIEKFAPKAEAQPQPTTAPTYTRCAECKHWNIHKDDHGYEGILFDIDPITYENVGEPKAKYCKSPKISFYETPCFGGASVVDGSQYKAELITSPDFGCVNFEERTADIKDGDLQQPKVDK